MALPIAANSSRRGAKGTMAALCIAAASTAATLSFGSGFSAFPPPRNAATQAPYPQVAAGSGESSMFTSSSAEAKGLPLFPMLIAATLTAVWGRSRPRMDTRSSSVLTRAPGRVARQVQGSVEGVRVLSLETTGNPLTEIVMTELHEGVVALSGLVSATDAGLSEELELAKGSTDNCYLLHGGTGSIDQHDGALVLVDVMDARFEEAFLEKLAPYLPRLAELVLTILDQQHLAALPALVKARDEASAQGKLKVYCAEPAVQMLHEDPDLMALNLDVHTVESGSHIPVPPSKSESARAEHQRLRVVLCPTPRFPEALSAFDERNGFLYSGKFFSAHKRVEDVSVDPRWEELAVDWAHLKDCYFFTQSARDAVNQIFKYAGDTDLEDGFDPEEPDIEALAPLHGPVVRKEAWRLMAKYSCWLERKLNVDDCQGSAVIVHASAYGNTKTMADAVARGVEAGGLTVQMLNLEFCDAVTVESAIRQADGFAVGSPTLGGQMPIQVKEAVGVMLRVAQSGSTEIPCGVFGSFGWSGEAVPEINIRLMDGGFKSAFDPIQCKMKPRAKDLKICEEAGTRLAQRITEGKKRTREAKLKRQFEAAQKRSARITGEQVDSMEKAFGRIINSSCMITLKLGDRDDQLRLPISWVSQASFEPPGVMVAIEQTDIDSFLLTPVEEQMGALFKKYDKDNSGCLDREEITSMLDQLWGLAPGQEAGAGFQERKEEALMQLSADGRGTVGIDEFRQQATSGLLAEQISLQRRLTALQAMVGGEEKDHMKFTISVLPSGLSALHAMGAGFAKKAKTSNGCGVIDGAIAFLECRAMQAVPSGSCILLYCEVKAGKVLDPVSKAELLDEEGRVVLAEGSKENVKAPAMAALGLRRPGAAVAGGRLAGALPCQGRRHSVGPRRALALAGEEVLTEEDSWTGLTPGKEYNLQTQCREVAENTRTIRSLDWQRDRFDIEFALTHGTTYNAYTIRGAEKTALIDSTHKKFESQFMAVLETPTGGAVDLASLDYIIVSHTEPDHSGLVEKLVLEAKARGNDKLIVVGAKICINFLKELVHVDFKSQVVKGGDQIDLGGGHVLDFVIAPNLHWPDTMFTYDNKTKLLYTCDAFGMHYCSKNITDLEGADVLAPHFQLYYNCLMRPNARSVVSAIKKVGELPGHVEAIMTGHGPVLVQDKDHWVGQYQTWSQDALKNLGPSMCIFWVSRHGAAEERAQAFALGATSADVLVEMQDLNAVDAFEIVEAVHRNQVIVVFAPPMGKAGKAAQQALGSVIAACAPKENSFIVCKGGGEAEEPADAIVSRFVQVGIPEALPVLRAPSGSTTTVALNLFEATARDLGKKLRDKKRAKKNKSNEAALEALGKVSSGRYIITAAKDGVASAAIATWVMPASRQPPFVAVAIAKDSDVNSLMHSHDTFVLNLLAEGAYTDNLKHFQQDFPPGSDVFAGIDTTQVAVPGGGQGIVIRGCGGHVTCRVISRMEAADHDIVTGEVVEGEMVKDVPVAANHRKSGAYY